MINENVFSKSEKVIFGLRELYSAYGYKPYRMSKFEEYDLYASNKNFLVSDNVITFTDTTGKLMALKPDVTLSIIKNSKDLPEVTQKVWYGENVYRVSKGTNAYQEIMQTGLECFGNVQKENVCEVITLAAKSLLAISPDVTLAVSSHDVIEYALDAAKCPTEKRAAVYKSISAKNMHDLASLFPSLDFSSLTSLLAAHGKMAEVLPALKRMGAQTSDFIDILSALPEEVKDLIYIDFSVLGDVNYYNGILFKGFVRGLPNAVLSGGQYDRLMQKLGHKSKAIGFAVYTDELERIEESGENEKEEFVNIALPKGRLGEKVYAIFEKAGFPCDGILDSGSRKLIFENAEKKVRYFWVKPSDVAIYVERGAADIGVAGKDILLEYKPDVCELADLGMGKCRMAVAGPKTFSDDGKKTLRVATKFASIATDYYRSKGRDIDIIHLNGSIEIAPILGLSDVIVDIVETGTTLKENDLEIKEVIVPISARLVANKSASKFKEKQIENIAEKISALLQGEK